MITFDAMRNKRASFDALLYAFEPEPSAHQ
ncbi:elongation factor tu [Enterobacter sp. EA-1]|nr:elongation factor tu [Enterobacter sp. EA-1]